MIKVMTFGPVPQILFYEKHFFELNSQFQKVTRCLINHAKLQVNKNGLKSSPK